MLGLLGHSAGKTLAPAGHRPRRSRSQHVGKRVGQPELREPLLVPWPPDQDDLAVAQADDPAVAPALQRRIDRQDKIPVLQLPRQRKAAQAHDEAAVHVDALVVAHVSCGGVDGIGEQIGRNDRQAHKARQRAGLRRRAPEIAEQRALETVGPGRHRLAPFPPGTELDARVAQLERPPEVGVAERRAQGRPQPVGGRLRQRPLQRRPRSRSPRLRVEPVGHRRPLCGREGAGDPLAVGQRDLRPPPVVDVAAEVQHLPPQRAVAIEPRHCGVERLLGCGAALLHRPLGTNHRGDGRLDRGHPQRLDRGERQRRGADDDERGNRRERAGGLAG